MKSPPSSAKPIFLPAVDLEDVRLLMPDGERYVDRVPANTIRYLDFFKQQKIRATFFTVGEVALRHPELIARIAGEGHEVASHSMRHTPLDQMTADTFMEDTERSLDALKRAGITRVEGFRAPVFSLTERTAWAHERLGRLGFIYSSSVLPAQNPLFGWPGFGAACRKMDGGIWEIPMSVGTDRKSVV
jgi:peptidoglycan/xylan/chitin deacetylase (PgdA/CDA1 family)